jgi:PD-(D/E)XK nuclease superfamily
MKRMLELNDDGHAFINSSSAEIINTCLRKAQYALKRNLRREGESDALTFGTAIHAALAAFYNGQRDLEYIHKIFEHEAKPLAHLDNDKRSIANGKKILERYVATYENDPWTVYYDDKGPFIERSFELPLTSKVTVHGTIDCILKNTETGELVVCDHKTTSTVSDLINRVKPNLQFSIYAWAANQLGIPVTRVMVNGIQVAKTKSDFVRIFTDRTEEDFQEMRMSLADAVNRYNFATTMNTFPQNSGSCANWGGCPYLEICQTGMEHREAMIAQIYGE